MKKLHKHPLMYESVLEFVRGSLENTNLLSIELLKFIYSQPGEFFTLLPDDADLSRLYLFDSYILKQNPMIEYGSGEKKARYQITPTIRDELCGFLIDKVKKNRKLICVFDDFNSTYKDGYDDDLFTSCGIHYNTEVYYVVDSSMISKKALLECLRVSNTFWHSVCIVAEISKEDIDKELTSNKLHEICCKTQLAIFGAYDGESYIFWEKK